MPADEPRPHGFYWLHLLQAYRVVIDEVELRFSRAPVSLVEYELLWRLSRTPGESVPVQKLNEAMLLTPSGVTRLLNRMEQAGLVRRLVSGKDRRRISAVLTDEGRRLHDDYSPLFLRAVDDSYLRHLDPEELEQLDAMFQKLIVATGRQPEPQTEGP